MASPRALRVGILIRNNLVEERVLAGTPAVTFGQSLRCTLSVPVEGLPREHALFVRDQGRFLLRLTSDMDGRLAQGDRVQTFADLRVGSPVDGAWSVPLAPGVRGKLSLGDATLLFQEMAAPPIMPRPQLPPSVRGTFADRVDRRLAVIVGTSLAFHIGVACWAWMTDVEDDTPVAMVQEQEYRPETLEFTMPDLTPPPVAPPTEPGVATPPVAPAHVAPHPVVVPHHPHDPGLRPEHVDPNELAAFLTGDTPSDHGHNELPHRMSTANLDDQIRDAKDRHVTIGDDPRIRDPHARIGTGGDPNVDGTDGPTEVKKGPENPGTPLPPDPHPKKVVTTLTSDMVLAKINRDYVAGLRRCYQKGLVHDASLQGKIRVALVVDGNGQVVSPSANGVSDEVDSCVQNLMTGWSFPAPKDPSGNPTQASFHLSLALQSS